MIQNLAKFSDEDLISLTDAGIDKELRSRGYVYGWYRPESFAGVIYILVNPAFPNLVKIGYADDVEKRLRVLNRNSGLPDPFHVYATYKVKKRLEDLKLHELIDSLDPDLRHSRNREFYEMSADAAYNILSAIAEINGSNDLLVKNPFLDDFFGEEEVIGETELPIDESEAVVPNGVYHMLRMTKKFGIEFSATLRVQEGRYVVEAGCVANIQNVGSVPPYVARMREQCLDEKGVSTQDVEFTSVSAAAAFVTGRATNGWWAWQTDDGRYIDVFRK